MKPLSAKFHISLGQVSLLVSLLLVAIYLGLVPDRVGAVREGRASLAETIAASSAQLISRGDMQRLESLLRFVVDRNEDVLSIAVRPVSGGEMVTIGDHESHWVEMTDEFSTDSQTQVPIWSGEREWGRVEVRSRPLTAPGWRGMLQNKQTQLIVFVALFAFLVFYLYLGKMLRQLDPSQAIPGRVRSALDTMVEGLLVIDPKGRIALANRAFASLVGRTPDDLVGMDTFDFAWSGNDGARLAPESYPWIETLRDGGAQSGKTVCLQDLESKRRTFYVNCSPVGGNEKKPSGVLVSFDDVTQLEEKETELRKSKDEAVAANQAKSDFLANMSHEIRTPMNAILGFTEILKRGYGKSERDSKKHLNTIHASGKHLLELINDVLDLSKVEAGRLEVEQVPCAAHIVVGDVVQALGVKAREKSISLDYEAEGRIPAAILSDPARLRQIVTNLLGNAIKFTEKGGVKVVIRIVTADKRKQLAVDVVDSGIGIPEDKLDTVFEEFAQADASVTRRFGGTGLGLAISKRFAQALGGDISIRSELGKGSVFTATVDTGPLDDVDFLEPQAAVAGTDVTSEAETTRWEFPAARVLVVDDGDENRELVTILLEEAGLHVEGAENGQIAVDKAMANSYDVILMDMQMPVMDGYTATRHLREHGLKTPIVAFTAHAMKGFEQEIMAAGCSGYLTKPVVVEELYQTLAQQVGGRSVTVEEGAIQDQRSRVEDDARDEHREVDPPLVSRLPVDNPRFKPIIEKFVGRLGEQVESMDRAWQARDLKELASLAHWLKGAGGTVGFDAFTEPAGELEQLAKNGNEAEIEPVLSQVRRLSRRVGVSGDGPANAESSGVRGAAPGTSASPARISAPSKAPASGPPLVSRLPANNPRFRPIIEKFVARLGKQMEAMDRAWSARDFDEMASLGHWLKGAGGTVGFDAFTEPAGDLEQFAKAKSDSQVEQALAVLHSLAERVVIERADDSTDRGVPDIGEKASA